VLPSMLRGGGGIVGKLVVIDVNPRRIPEESLEALIKDGFI
jgi:hypothetical protein